MDNEIHDRINDNIYEGKVLEFRRDSRRTDSLAIGNGTYRFLPRKGINETNPIPPNGGEAA